MDAFKTKIRRLIYTLKHGFFTFDRIVLGLAIALCLSWAWSSINTMTRNWELVGRLESKRRTATLLELEVSTLEYEKAYYQSDEYLELAARRIAGKMLEGETLVVLPDNSKNAKTKHQPPLQTAEQKPDNFNEWLRFLFGPS